jgi:hypothetical protein
MKGAVYAENSQTVKDGERSKSLVKDKKLVRHLLGRHANARQQSPSIPSLVGNDDIEVFDFVE